MNEEIKEEAAGWVKSMSEIYHFMCHIDAKSGEPPYKKSAPITSRCRVQLVKSSGLGDKRVYFNCWKLQLVFYRAETGKVLRTQDCLQKFCLLIE